MEEYFSLLILTFVRNRAQSAVLSRELFIALGETAVMGQLFKLFHKHQIKHVYKSKYSLNYSLAW